MDGHHNTWGQDLKLTKEFYFFRAGEIFLDEVTLLAGNEDEIAEDCKMPWEVSYLKRVVDFQGFFFLLEDHDLVISTQANDHLPIGIVHLRRVICWIL